MIKYQPYLIEPKWQKEWKDKKLYFTDLSNSKKKYYILAELAYTSGDLHMGHWFTFAPADTLARLKRMQGFNVVFPNGFDAFGLPAENAAIKRGVHPSDWTYENAERMKEQFETLGTSIDWTKTMIACDPDYYRWNQWIFLKMYEKGLAYKGKTISNWCPSCQTVLADENVESGKCWRCGSDVVKKQVEQWFYKITDYADRLIWLDPPQADYPKSLIEAQNSWIGRSEGVSIKFEEVEVFTTRPDTVFGATFIVLSPEHPFLASRSGQNSKLEDIRKYVEESNKKSEQERKEQKEKTGVFTGSYVENPFTKQKIPIWVADYVLMGVGSGAIMAVPAHDKRDFEFAKKYGLEIKTVILGSEATPESDPGQVRMTIDNVYEGDGKLINSGEFTGQKSNIARLNITKYIEENNLGSKKVNYHLRDWSISRQRYWGTPIPIIYCDKCGVVPVPEEDLPVELPYKVDFTPKGKPPLATAEEWVRVSCPKCGGPAVREVETMDGFMDNSWYFYRYLDPKNKKEIFNSDLINTWMPLEIYIGGAEHTYGHALYSRFFTKFFHDLGIVDFDEYAKKRVHHGVILGPDGHRMSKSRGNVVNPDEEVKKYGADAIRLYLMFLGPYQEIIAPWNPEGVTGVYHFLQRVWALNNKVFEAKLTATDLSNLHKTIKKVSIDLGEMKFNTAIAALMEWLNYLSRKEKITKEEYETFLKLLAPFAPHITEELWQLVHSSELIVHDEDKKNNELSTINHIPNWSIHQSPWPEYDEKYLQEDQIKLPIQVNGKLREILMVDKDLAKNEAELEKLALKSLKVQKFLAGKTPKKIIYAPGKVLNIVA